MVRRWVIFGAAAIGATIGGRFHAAGREVVLVARGAHLEALRRDGLLSNVGNALQVTLGPEVDTDGLHARAREEALACYRAAGIHAASDREVDERIEVTRTLLPAGGHRHTGGSSWQSVVRGTGRIEADYLNGEIVLLGRLHGVPTPVNEGLQRAALRVAREGLRPGALSRADLGL